jgi:pimeloyl-ACP methyl ester carboxylesterase
MTITRVAAALALLVLALMAQATAQERKPGPLGPMTGEFREQEWLIPWERAGRTWLAHAKIFRPSGDAPRPLVLIAHGAPISSKDNAAMRPSWADAQARWFAAQSFAVVVPVRRGYGLSDGPVQEGYRSCDNPDYAVAGSTTANDIQGILAYMATQPYVDAIRTVVVGQSAGGWGTVALAARNPKGVVAIINFAGGRGGGHETPCVPQRLVEAATQFGRSAKTPMLWISSENDKLFSADHQRRMFAGFARGAQRAEQRILGPFRNDGHALFSNPAGMAMWTPVVSEFLSRVGFRAP